VTRLTSTFLRPSRPDLVADAQVSLGEDAILEDPREPFPQIAAEETQLAVAGKLALAAVLMPPPGWIDLGLADRPPCRLPESNGPANRAPAAGEEGREPGHAAVVDIAH